MTEAVNKILESAGVASSRLALDWASASEAPVFVNLITGFTDAIRDMGPLGGAEGMGRDEMKSRLAAALDLARSLKFRTRLGKLARDVRKQNDYSPARLRDLVEEKMGESIAKEINKRESAAQPAE